MLNTSNTGRQKSLTFRNYFFSVLVFLTVLCGLSSQHIMGGPPIIDDKALIKNLDDHIGKLTEEYEGISSKSLSPQYERKSTALTLPPMNETDLDDIYASSVNSVGIISSVYKCNKCPKWHRAGGATCWVLTADGVMVTNYHVFHNKKFAGFGVMMRDGSVSPVVEVLAVDKEHDILIFKVDGGDKKFEPLPLGKAQRVGGSANIIAHPDSRFFTYTQGKVSRYYVSRSKKKCYWMAVTAEYARGSSGGPVMDDAGNVIGMVANTSSIYYPSKDPKKNPVGNLQMTIRNCVPVEAIRNMITTTMSN
jgi:serine protease Do